MPLDLPSNCYHAGDKQYGDILQVKSLAFVPTVAGPVTSLKHLSTYCLPSSRAAQLVQGAGRRGQAPASR